MYIYIQIYMYTDTYIHTYTRTYGAPAPLYSRNAGVYCTPPSSSSAAQPYRGLCGSCSQTPAHHPPTHSRVTERRNVSARSAHGTLRTPAPGHPVSAGEYLWNPLSTP